MDKGMKAAKPAICLYGACVDAVSLSWDDPGDMSITDYQVRRRDKDLHAVGVFLGHVDDMGSASTAYVDEDVTLGARHVYRIKAWNAAGLSERSEWFDVDMPAAPTSANSPATGAPNISVTAQVGETLTADTSGIADADGLANVSYSYQWIRNDGSSDTDITGAADSSYTLVAADDCKTIKVRVSFTDDAANEETLTSAATEAVSFAVQPQTTNSPATGAPAVSGTAQAWETLTADTTGEVEDKHFWLVAHDGLVFGSGWHHDESGS